MVKIVAVLFVAAAASAQDPAPAVSPSADPEAALRERVQQFYQLQQDGKFRQAEAMVADDTKDDYYAARKAETKGFRIDKIEMYPDRAHAKVTMKVKTLVLMPGVGAQVMETAPPTYWKIENGEWRWYIPEEIRNLTPFGRMATGESGARGPDMKGQAPGGIEKPDVGALQGQISMDLKSVELSEAAPDRVVTISNGLPGGTDLRLDPHAGMIAGLVVKLDKTHLESGEKASVHLHWEGKRKVADTVEIVAFPLNVPLDIAVRSK